MAAVRPPTFDELYTADAESARRWFVETWTEFLLGVIRRKVRDRDGIMDAYVYALERLLADDCRRLRAYRHTGSSFEAYLAVATTRLAVDWLRSRGGRNSMSRLLGEDEGRTESIDPGPGPEELMMGREAKQRVDAALATSRDAPSRLVFWLNVEHGRKPAEIAAMLGLAAPRVSEMLRSARDAVRREAPGLEPAP